MSAPDVWLDTVTPKISITINSMLPILHKKGYSTLVTAKTQTQTTDMLDVLKVPYKIVGTYGTTLKEKLAAEQRRTLEFLDLFDRVGYPKVLWTHGDVSAIRTAFGLKIPIVYANDTIFAHAVAKLSCPLVNYLIAPKCFGKSWNKFGIPKTRIIHYDGLEELAYVGTEFEKPKFLEKLDNQKKPIILFRDAEYQAVYCKDVKVDSGKLLQELAKLGTVICLPRYKEEKATFENISNVWVPSEPVLTAQLMPYIDLMIGSGGTACRETTLCGIPTINFHFWDVQARYLYDRGFPIQIIRNNSRIIMVAKKILTKPQKIDTRKELNRLESPIPVWIKYLELSLQNKTSPKHSIPQTQ
jgi:predicted glycosyltransferase